MRNIIKQILKEEVDSRSERVKSIVNKYGIDKAIEVLGGMEIIRNAYQNNPLEFLNQFNDLTPFEEDDSIYYKYKDGNSLFMYYPNEKNGVVYINYEKIWMFFSEVFRFEYSVVQDIINNWLEETYNLRGLKPQHIYPSKSNVLEETYNLK